jgi:uncharacterized protein (UPF0303 family)
LVRGNRGSSKEALTVPIADDLRRVDEQERRLVFDRFDPATAWRLGMALKEAAEAQSAAVAIDISAQGRPLFHVALPGTSADNHEWIRRKRNVVLRFLRSSGAAGLQFALEGADPVSKYGLPTQDYAAVGGSFPLTVPGASVIGAVTVSGLLPWQDHALIVQTLARFLDRDVSDIGIVPG